MKSSCCGGLLSVWEYAEVLKYGSKVSVKSHVEEHTKLSIFEPFYCMVAQVLLRMWEKILYRVVLCYFAFESYINTGTLNMNIVLNKLKYTGNTMSKRAHLMHHHPKITLPEQTFIWLKSHPTLDRLTLTKILPSSQQAKGSVTRVKIGQEHPCNYKKIKNVYTYIIISTFCNRLRLVTKWLSRPLWLLHVYKHFLSHVAWIAYLIRDNLSANSNSLDLGWL